MDEDTLQVTVDKFTFHVNAGYAYTADGIWIDVDGARRIVRVGLTDFRQQSSGDAAFVELPEIGQQVHQGDDLASVETVKVDLALSAPFGGEIVAVNEALRDAPELINQDPYGAGWLAEISPASWPVEGLLDAHAYLALMTRQAQEETDR